MFYRRTANHKINLNDDFYEWEMHIFFDDAMTLNDDKQLEPNKYVKFLCTSVRDEGRKWYKKFWGKGREHPQKCQTPYGGRLVWSLPGGTQIICHLKDKQKIRHKKRWSQCMYMYYFLGYQLRDNLQLTDKQKELRSANTYLLALDGDVDFRPDAILKLVDLMKRDPRLGASCGRIHPTGGGYIQWYQKFEYAIGHWMQKSTEHILGCVLCSPGCFSLFRGAAVMDKNVMRTYTTVSTEARHYVQYDQGEDRWLCTLLLQQGWRVEYSAASDSFTACPEGFAEFYNQRRRWTPSTIANIADLLSNSDRVLKNNDDISYFFILYQIMMLVGTILGPGSIFIVLSGGLEVVGLSTTLAFVLNLVPITAFIVICFFDKSKGHKNTLTAAQLLSVLYVLLMIAVTVGMLITIVEDHGRSPTAFSFFLVIFCWVFPAVLHPQEFGCLPNAFIYWLTIPSMYLLLMIYSVFNLNDVSWGTREDAPKKLTEEEQKKKADEEEKKKSWWESITGKNSKLAFWRREGMHREVNMKLDQLDTKLEMRLNRLELALRREGYDVAQEARGAETQEQQLSVVPQTREATGKEEEARQKEKAQNSPKIPDALHRLTGWIKDEDLGRGEEISLDPRENQFWEGLIKEYLMPEKKKTDEEAEAVQNKLLEMRNQMVFSFLMINSIWIVTMFLMQQYKDVLGIKWKFTATVTSMEWNLDDEIIFLTYDYDKLEPIGLFFIFWFIGILFIQLIGMIMHRILTLGHIVSSTSVREVVRNWFRDDKDVDGEDVLKDHGVNMIKGLVNSAMVRARVNKRVMAL